MRPTGDEIIVAPAVIAAAPMISQRVVNIVRTKPPRRRKLVASDLPEMILEEERAPR